MSKIDIRHAHAMPKAKARKAIEEVARTLAEKFQVVYGWEGDTLKFARPGVDGEIALEPKGLHVQAKLGFLTAMFKEPIEGEIKRVLKDKF